jgi:predicted nucleic acid-binding protein
LKIYLDTCCLSRLFDNQTQKRIRQETQAIASIIGFFTTNWQWIISDFLMVEIKKNPNSDQRNTITDILNYAHQTVYVSEQEVLRAIHLKLLGFKIEDALHLACAERGGVDVFLTTDDKLIRKTKSGQVRNQLFVQVENPYTWLQEVFKNEHPSGTK